jgi:hypothetical protein
MRVFRNARCSTVSWPQHKIFRFSMSIFIEMSASKGDTKSSAGQDKPAEKAGESAEGVESKALSFPDDKSLYNKSLHFHFTATFGKHSCLYRLREAGLVCGQCDFVCQLPVELPGAGCGHVFCMLCVNKAMVCPTCKAEVTSKLTPSFTVQSGADDR